MKQNIHDYIVEQENSYQQPIDINGWQWNMPEHVKTSFYYKHGRLLGGNDENTPVKNITKPILNLQYRALDIDVKEVNIYVDDPQAYHLSFLVKKYYEDVFAVDNTLDTFFDEIKESMIDYGLGIAKKMKGAKPDVVDLQSIAFCDQTNVESGPIGIKHHYNPAELKDMEKVGWGNPSNGATATIDEVIAKSEPSKVIDEATNVEISTPGAYIEIYEVHGVLPKSFITDEYDDNTDTQHVQQIQIVAFYTDEKSQRRSMILYRKEEKESPFMFLLRDKIYSRACGWGGAEELFEDQIWTNLDVIRMNDMLDSASKTILKSVGADLKSRYPNGLKNMDNLQIVELNEGEDLGQVDTFPRNMQLFQQSAQQWEQHAQTMGSAQDPLLGKEAPSGTPFRSVVTQIEQGKGIHEYRKEKYARFLEDIHQQWILPYIQGKITQGATFLSELSTDEMKFVSDALVKNKAKRFAFDKMLNGELVTDEEIEGYKQLVRQEFVDKGNKKFIEILKDEFKKRPLRVKVDIAGASKDLSLLTDKMTNIFRQIIANPQGFQQTMQIPGMAKTFNTMLESSGLSPIMYAGLTESVAQAPQQPQQPQAQPEQAQAQALTTNLQ